jgi:putative transposase
MNIQSAECNFTVTAPNQAWTGDITYIQTGEGWLFLAWSSTYSAPVSWAGQCNQRCAAAWSSTRWGWRGSGAAPTKARDISSIATAAANMPVTSSAKCPRRASMSRKGSCWDDAPSEALFASLRVGRLHSQRFETIRQAKDETTAWLFWYSQSRMHSTLNYVNPVQSEQHWQHNQRALGD